MPTLRLTRRFAKPTSFGIVIHRVTHVPSHKLTESRYYVYVEVVCEEQRMASAATRSKKGSTEIRWDTTLSFPDDGGNATDQDVTPDSWKVYLTEVRVELWNGSASRLVANTVIPLAELLTEGRMELMIWDEKEDALCDSEPPFAPTKIEMSVEDATVPGSWPKFVKDEGSYDRHIFMMTRGTRGDVQPFLALARGMAEEHGWLITICTEMPWKSFVLNNSLSRGKIQFRPSGGNTEKRISTSLSKWAMQHTSELIQMSILASAEAEFFPSTTVFLDHVRSLEHTRRVDLVVYGLTVVGVALLIGELCAKPIIGFILQPSIIPSKDKTWTAVQAIQTHNLANWFDRVEEKLFTSHHTLGMMKVAAESNPLTRWNLPSLRKALGLRPVNTWVALRTLNSAMVIPMREGTFERPSDWWDNVCLSDFIFMRSAAGTKLTEPLASFVSLAKREGGRLMLMTFSSMIVSRLVVLRICIKMVKECRFDLRLIYVGKKFPDEIPANITDEVRLLEKESRFLEIEKADFGVLFQEMDAFVVHGGLGTTVEALRMKKPCIVTGPLLMDQRFWGGCCHRYGVGPETQHISQFENFCVQFADGASDPKDPRGWQEAARQVDMGDVKDDGVAKNVAAFKGLLDRGLQAPPLINATAVWDPVAKLRTVRSMYDFEDLDQIDEGETLRDKNTEEDDKAEVVTWMSEEAEESIDVDMKQVQRESTASTCKIDIDVPKEPDMPSVPWCCWATRDPLASSPDDPPVYSIDDALETMTEHRM